MSFDLRLVLFVLGISLLSLPSCRCLDCDDDGGGGTVQLDDAPWTATNLTTRGRITSLFATPDELFVFTPVEFVRGTVEDTVFTTVDRRPFPSALRTLGRPAVNNLAFVRGVLNTTTSEQLLEFQLTQNAGASITLAIDSLGPELVSLEEDASAIGAFNDEARVYVQPVIRRTDRNVALLFFTLDYNPSFTAFTSIEYNGLVALPNVTEDDKIVSDIDFIDGSFYVSTKRGLYRVSESGVVETVLDNFNDIRDVFRYQGDLFATKASTAPLLQSEDGFNFRQSFVQEMYLTQIEGPYIVTQNFEGWEYLITDDLAQQTKPMKLNPDFPTARDVYFGLERWDNRYYLGVDQRLYVADDLEQVD